MIKYIGQHIFDFIARFRSDVYLENIADGTVASDKFLGLDSNNKIVKETVSSGISFDGSTANGVLTYKDSDEASVEPLLTYNGSTNDMVMTSFSSGKPTIQMVNANADVESPEIVMTKQSTGISSNGDDIGEFRFTAYNSANEVTGFAKILAEIKSVTDTDEAGDFTIQVATSNGTTSNLRNALYAEGSPSADDVDVTIGHGSTSLTTMPGGARVTSDLQVGGELNLGNPTDTTLARSAAGKVTIEGNQIVTAGAVSVASEAQAPISTMVARRTITQAEANNMHSTPIEIVPAQGANTVIIPLGGMVRIDRATTQSQSACDWNMHYADQEPGTYGTASIQHIRRFMYNETGDRIFHITPGIASNEVAQSLTEDTNKAVEVSFDSAATTNAFTGIDVYLTYYVIQIS